MFLDAMREKVKGKGKQIIFAEGNKKRAVRAAALVRDKNLAKPILLGPKDEIERAAEEAKVDLKEVKLIDPSKDEHFDDFVNQYMEIRKHKGISKEEAADKMKRPNYYGAMLLHSHKADGMVAGLSSETKPFVPAFEIIKLKEGYKRASSLFVLEWPERLLFFADCAVNIDPDAQALAEIAHATAQTVRSYGYEPRIAFLSFSTRDSAKGAPVDKVKEAVRLSKIDCHGCVLDGEIQFDAALLPEVARRKAPDSPFVEKGANVFIFPNLDSGNIAYKICERLGHAVATGPILQGLNHPVNDVSRGTTFEGLANVAVLTAATAILNEATSLQHS